MCNFNQGFILCKCNDPRTVVHNKKSRRNKGNSSVEYALTLNRFIGRSEKGERGRYVMPINDIGYGLTADFVVNQLNIRNCFDFDYIPNEGDNLIITRNEPNDRIEFIFKNGKWIDDHYSPFNHETETFDNGKLKV